MEKCCSVDKPIISHQINTKRPKLEVRRAEGHNFHPQINSSCQNQADDHSKDIVSREYIHTDALVKETAVEASLKLDNTPQESSCSTANGRNDTASRARNLASNAETGSEYEVSKIPTNPINNRQCVAFIESKRRRCERWANDGDAYCCVHLASRFNGNMSTGARNHQSHMCEGTTVLGNHCKHRSLNGSSFCKKHKHEKETNSVLNALEAAFKRTHSSDIDFEGESGDQTHPISIIKNDTSSGSNSAIDKHRDPNLGFKVDEMPHCIGDGTLSTHFSCRECPKRFALYCDKHIPSWLKRARNRRSRIITKEVFIDLLQKCESQEQRCKLHQACELFYKLIKTILSLRNPVPLEIQLQWALSEASKDVDVGKLLLKLVSAEKEILVKSWGFLPNEGVDLSIVAHESNTLPLAITGTQGDNFPKHNNSLTSFIDQQRCYTHSLPNHHCLDDNMDQKSVDKQGHHARKDHAAETSSFSKKFVCKHCGFKFGSLLSLHRHIGVAHGAKKILNRHQSKQSLHYHSHRLKSAIHHHSRFKKIGGTKKLKSRKVGGSIRRCVTGSKFPFSWKSIWKSDSNDRCILGKMSEWQCLMVAKILFSGIQKVKPCPRNSDILEAAQVTCCKVSLRASLESKFGILSDRLCLKAARLCSENNVQVMWHQEGFVCPRGCKAFKDSGLNPPLGFSNSYQGDSGSSLIAKGSGVDEVHFMIDFHHLSERRNKSLSVLCADVSFGKEKVAVPCVVDEDISNSLDSSAGLSKPWENFSYVTNSLYNESLIFDNKSLQLGCNCSHASCSGSCDHVYLFNTDFEGAKDVFGQSMIGRFPYNDKGQVILEEGYVIYECNNMCACSKTCHNRTLQNGVRAKLEIFRTKNKGWAVRAAEQILRGMFVCEYIGEIVDGEEALRRFNRYKDENCKYIFNVDVQKNDLGRLMEKQSSFIIDSTRYGNVSRFINHSCMPNLMSYQVLVESMDPKHAHIGLFASQDIASGEELTYDYGVEPLHQEGLPCFCGAPKCRGRLF